ncbi:MAG TPA: hypothetical protein VK203_26335 [Nostocaceae cyanobacterium]|nr:hypothetical protein [Nostocaceae cyanobacterium]
MPFFSLQRLGYANCHHYFYRTTDCLTDSKHSGVEMHSFVSYLVKCNLEGRTYKRFEYKAKQVGDNIHS